MCVYLSVFYYFINILFIYYNYFFYFKCLRRNKVVIELLVFYSRSIAVLFLYFSIAGIILNVHIFILYIIQSILNLIWRLSV